MSGHMERKDADAIKDVLSRAGIETTATHIDLLLRHEVLAVVFDPKNHPVKLKEVLDSFKAKPQSRDSWPSPFRDTRR